MRLNVFGLGHVRGILWWGHTDSTGHYTAKLLSNKPYVAFAWKSGFLPQWFDHKSTPQEADILTFMGDSTGIDFSLSPKPPATDSISGIVMDSTGTGVASRIILIPVNPIPFVQTFRAGFTDSLGAYMIANVQSGQYFVLAIPFSGFAPSFYKAGAFGVRKARMPIQYSCGSLCGINIGVVAITGGGFAHLGGTVHGGGNAVRGPTSSQSMPTAPLWDTP